MSSQAFVMEQLALEGEQQQQSQSAVLASNAMDQSDFKQSHPPPNPGPAILVASPTPTTPHYPSNNPIRSPSFDPYRDLPDEHAINPAGSGRTPHGLHGPKPSYASSRDILGSRSPSPDPAATTSRDRSSRVPLFDPRSGTMPGTGGPSSIHSAATVTKFGMTLEKRSWKLLLSYAPDWFLTIGLTAGFFMLDKVEGFRREFDLTDTSIQHTFAVHERVPNWMLVAICAGGPFVLMPILNYLTVRKWWDLHNSLLGVVLSLGMTGTITNVVKILVGRPRPDLIDRCQPAEGSANAPVYGLVTSVICTRQDLLKDGFRSFPSGHSSLSFAGLGFLAFYIAGKLHLWDERGHTGKAWLSVAPLVGAALVAVSRTEDNRHHWQDVTVGSILGIIIAHFSYRQYYPPLNHPLSHQPYSPRIPRDEGEIMTIPARSESIMSYPPPMSAGVHHPTQLRQFSQPVNATPYQQRVYGPSPGEIEAGVRRDQMAYTRGRSESPEEGTGVEGTVPRPV